MLRQVAFESCSIGTVCIGMNGVKTGDAALRQFALAWIVLRQAAFESSNIGAVLIRMGGVEASGF